MKPNKQKRGQQPSPQHQRTSVDIDVEALALIENQCNGCAAPMRNGQAGTKPKCCCSSYEVCATSAEVKRIIKVLPEVAKLCPHLLIEGGYDNVFEEEEPGLFSIDTDDDGLCVFAYPTHNAISCGLHTTALKLGLPLELVKPKVCLLWPMHFSDGEEVLSVIDDAFEFSCNVRKAPGSRTLSTGFVEVIDMVYGDGCGSQVQAAAENGERRTLVVTRR